MELNDGAGAGGEGGGAAALLGGGAEAGGGEQQQQQGGGEGGGSGGEGGGFEAPDWFEKLSAQAGDGETSSNRDYASSKGFKDLDSVFKSLRHAEKAIHDKGAIVPPKDGAKPEEVAAFRAAIGVPDKIDGYEIAPIENGKFDPNRAEGPDNAKHLPLNEPLVGAMKESALKHGAPKAVFEGMMNDFIAAQLDEASAAQAEQDSQVKDKLAEWGGKQAENIAHIDAAARALGLSAADLKWFRTMPGGAGRALDFVSKLGAGMAEDTLITGGKGRFGVSGAEAQAEIDRLKTDPEFQKKVLVTGSPERQRWDRLNLAAAEAKAAADAA